MITTNYEVLLDTLRPLDQIWLLEEYTKSGHFSKKSMISLVEKRPPLQVLDTIKAALTNENRRMFVFKFGFMLTHLYKNMFLYSGS